MEILKNKSVIAGICIVIALFITGLILKSSQDSERFDTLSPLFLNFELEESVFHDSWSDISSDKKISASELNTLVCVMNEKLCLPWYRLHIPLIQSNDIAEMDYLKRELKAF